MTTMLEKAIALYIHNNLATLDYGDVQQSFLLDMAQSLALEIAAYDKIDSILGRRNGASLHDDSHGDTCYMHHGMVVYNFAAAFNLVKE